MAIEIFHDGKDTLICIDRDLDDCAEDFEDEDEEDEFTLHFTARDLVDLFLSVVNELKRK
jgi:hypothetical protein